MDFDLSPRSEQWRKKLQAFFDAEVLPRHRAWLEHVAANNQTPPFMADLQQKARAAAPAGAPPALGLHVAMGTELPALSANSTAISGKGASRSFRPCWTGRN